MKVGTWNCNMAFRKKYKNILTYNPDLLIVPECENPANFEEHFYSDFTWIGDNKNKGLAVFSFNNLKISLYEPHNKEFKYILPLGITKNDEKIMNLIAVWAQDNVDPKRRYIGNVWCALNYYKDLFKEPVIIAGDFNWNVIWDREKSSLHGTLNDVINLLRKYSIYSTYHSIPDAIFGTNVVFGNEKDPTLFLLKNKDKPYHIDYIFTSKNFIENTESCYIGKYKDWIALSDHMPVFAEYVDTGRP
jgi:exodeoxyribonuclease III